MAPPKPAELIGATTDSVVLDKDVVEARVRLDSGQSQRLSAARSPQSMSAAAQVPDHVYLNLENVKSKSDAGLFYVYVNLPAGADPKAHPEYFAGTLSMFGVSKASAQSAPSGGNGLNASFDITEIVDKLSTDNKLSDDLSVKLVAAKPGGTSSDISIGHVRIYRQGQ